MDNMITWILKGSNFSLITAEPQRQQRHELKRLNYFVTRLYLCISIENTDFLFNVYLQHQMFLYNITLDNIRYNGYFKNYLCRFK